MDIIAANTTFWGFYLIVKPVEFDLKQWAVCTFNP